jgi:hypothetical protein
MDPTTASYYRAILYRDSGDSRPVPKTLAQMHAFAVRGCQGMGMSAMIARQSALMVAMTWMSTTKEGREFTRESTTLGEMFSEQDAAPAVAVEKAKLSRTSQPQLTGV